MSKAGPPEGGTIPKSERHRQTPEEGGLRALLGRCMVIGQTVILRDVRVCVNDHTILDNQNSTTVQARPVPLVLVSLALSIGQG